MIKKFKEFIEEGFLSKTLSRTKTNKERLGDIPELSPHEMEVYKLFKEWCKGGQFNITQGLGEPRHSFDDDWDDFVVDLYSKLSDLGCKEFAPNFSNFRLSNSINNGYCVVYTKRGISGIEPEISLGGFIDDEFNDFHVHYYNASNVSVMCRANRTKNRFNLNFKEKEEIYRAYEIPIKVFELIMSQNKLCQNF